MGRGGGRTVCSSSLAVQRTQMTTSYLDFEQDSAWCRGFSTFFHPGESPTEHPPAVHTSTPRFSVLSQLTFSRPTSKGFATHFATQLRTSGLMDREEKTKEKGGKWRKETRLNVPPCAAHSRKKKKKDGSGTVLPTGILRGHSGILLKVFISSLHSLCHLFKILP